MDIDESKSKLSKDPMKIAARQKRVQGQENRAKAVEFRRMGMSYSDIGKQLGITKQACHQAVERALDALGENTIKDTTRLRNEELDRLDRRQLAAWPMAMKGSTQHMAQITKMMERRAELNGVNIPQLIAITDSQGNDIIDVSKMTDEELDARIRELQAEYGTTKQ